MEATIRALLQDADSEDGGDEEILLELEERRRIPDTRRRGSRDFAVGDGLAIQRPWRVRLNARLLAVVTMGVGACAALLALRAFHTSLWGAFPRTAHVQAAGMWEAHSCERCPVGSCYRGSDGACKLWEGGYYCYVSSCGLIPEGLEFSGCWHWQGEPHYTLSDPEYKCRESDSSSANRSNASAEVNASNSTGGNDTSEASGSEEESVHEKNNRTNKAEKEALRQMADDVIHEEKHRHGDRHPKGNASGNATGGNASSVSSSEHQAAQEVSGLLPMAATHLVSVEPADPRLSAYWDTFSCGPMGDDHNSEWCGGLVKKAECQEEVSVDDTICYTGKAHLVSLLGGDGSDIPKVLNGCLFFYHAQYACLPSTTTTTSTTTSTTSVTATVTTVTSTTTTSTSTTATLTTTTTTTTTSTGPCSSKFVLPNAPARGTDLNGIHLPNTCFYGAGPHHVFLIGDWGGLMGEHGPKPARQRPKTTLVAGIDDHPQQRVAEQMRIRAAALPPDYVLNVGDNFYWAGLEATCGAPANTIIPTGQFEWNFEKVYQGPGLVDKPWLSVLGNHDYGGFLFMKGWDQQIAYSWSTSGRWVMPAQYWRSTVHYPDFSVDYFFVDTNVFDSEEPHADPEHNICSLLHNPPNASCGAEGPVNIWDCAGWFQRLWTAQKLWLEEGLGGSIADWQVIVTHFPPVWAQGFWKDLADRHGIDLIVSGHMHRQVINNAPGGFLYPTAWIVSGGGGGITSEDVPSTDGNDDQYGFFDLAFSKEVIEIQGITHGGQLRGASRVHPRQRAKHHLRPHDAPPPAAAPRKPQGRQQGGGGHPMVVFKKL